MKSYLLATISFGMLLGTVEAEAQAPAPIQVGSLGPATVPLQSTDLLIVCQTGTTCIARRSPLSSILNLTGTLTQVVCGPGLAGGTIATTGTCSLAPITGPSLLGYPYAGSGQPTTIALGSNLSFASNTLNATGGGGTGTITLAGAVTGSGTASIATAFGAIVAQSLIGNASGSSGVPGAIAIGTNLSFSGNTLNATGGTGTVTSVVCPSGTITTTGACTLAAASDGTVVSNIAGAPAVPVSNAFSSVIDHDIGSTQGDIPYRGSSGWVALAPGTPGQQLITGGGSANPAWEFRKESVTLPFSSITPVFSATFPVWISTKPTDIIIDSVDAVTAGSGTPTFTIQLVSNSATLTCGGGGTIDVGTIEATSTCTAGNTLAAGSSLNLVTVVTGGTNNPAGGQINYHVVP